METEEENWNKIVPDPPKPMTAPVTLTPIVKRQIESFKKTLGDQINIMNELEILNTEATILSTILYKYYRALRKDKGFQMLKMIMTSLKKYSQMDVLGCMKMVSDCLYINKSPLVFKTNLPTRCVIGWLMSRIQALAALFYRVCHLAKQAGKFLYLRIRLLWNPMLLFLCLGITARIYALSRFIVMQCVSWHSEILSFIKVMPKSNDTNAFKNYPCDLKEWLGGLDDVVVPAKRAKTSLDMIFDLVDLTNDDEEDFVEIIRELRMPDNNDDEGVERLLEVVTLDTNVNSGEEEDIGEVIEETVSDQEEIVIINSPRKVKTSSKKLKRKVSPKKQKIKSKRSKKRKMLHF